MLFRALFIRGAWGGQANPVFLDILYKYMESTHGEKSMINKHPQFETHKKGPVIDLILVYSAIGLCNLDCEAFEIFAKFYTSRDIKTLNDIIKTSLKVKTFHKI